MKIPFTLTRANFVDIVTGILQFSNEKEYFDWMNDNFQRFQICSNMRTKELTLVNFK